MERQCDGDGKWLSRSRVDLSQSQLWTGSANSSTNANANSDSYSVAKSNTDAVARANALGLNGLLRLGREQLHAVSRLLHLRVLHGLRRRFGQQSVWDV